MVLGICLLVRKKKEGPESLVFFNPRAYFSFLSFFFFLFDFATLNYFSREEEGVTTDVLPPSESCLFDGDSGAYHVA